MPGRSVLSIRSGARIGGRLARLSSRDIAGRGGGNRVELVGEPDFIPHPNPIVKRIYTTRDGIHGYAYATRCQHGPQHNREEPVVVWGVVDCSAGIRQIIDRAFSSQLIFV